MPLETPTHSIAHIFQAKRETFIHKERRACRSFGLILGLLYRDSLWTKTQHFHIDKPIHSRTTKITNPKALSPSADWHDILFAVILRNYVKKRDYIWLGKSCGGLCGAQSVQYLHQSIFGYMHYILNDDRYGSSYGSRITCSQISRQPDNRSQRPFDGTHCARECVNCKCALAIYLYFHLALFIV